jgi:hypothetical protein
LDGTSSPRRILFGGGVQPWLRAAVQRWARFRLGAGCTFSTVEVDVRAARWLSRFLTEVHPVTAAGLTRAVLEQYLSWLLGTGVAGTSKCNYLVVCAAFSTPATDTAGCGGARPSAERGSASSQQQRILTLLDANRTPRRQTMNCADRSPSCWASDEQPRPGLAFTDRWGH